MNFSFGNVMGSMLVSGVGWVFFRHGRKRSRATFTLFGAAMMVYPYFVTDWRWMVGIFAAMCSALYWLNRSGA